jgi:hypothetical protein
LETEKEKGIEEERMTGEEEEETSLNVDADRVKGVESPIRVRGSLKQLSSKEREVMEELKRVKRPEAMKKRDGVSIELCGMGRVMRDEKEQEEIVKLPSSSFTTLE